VTTEWKAPLRDVLRQRLDRLADLHESNADGIEDQPVGDLTAFQMGVDRGNGFSNVRVEGAMRVRKRGRVRSGE
jgi:hypothetical protein